MKKKKHSFTLKDVKLDISEFKERTHNLYVDYNEVFLAGDWTQDSLFDTIVSIVTNESIICNTYVIAPPVLINTTHRLSKEIEDVFCFIETEIEKEIFKIAIDMMDYIVGYCDLQMSFNYRLDSENDNLLVLDLTIDYDVDKITKKD